jgi:hypothetical protein
VDEMEIGELHDRTHAAYLDLLTCHVMGIVSRLPNVNWMQTPVIVVPEENTYVNNLEQIAVELKSLMAERRVNLQFYHRWNVSMKTYTVGIHIGINNKGTIINYIQSLIDDGGYVKADAVFSVGDHLLGEYRKGGSVQSSLQLETSSYTRGSALVKKLRDDMNAVSLTRMSTGQLKVTTGGKRSVQGSYTRDDLLAATIAAIGGFHRMQTVGGGFKLM